MKIAITGSSGFVGQNLQDYLKVDHEIRKLQIRFQANQDFNLDVNAVIHLAGKAHDLKKVSKPLDYYQANFELTKQLFDSFLNSKTEIFVFMSSVKACADNVNGILIEEDISHPTTHYGISKFQAEEYILSKEIPKDKRVYILRPCMIHGPGNKGNLNLLYSIVAKGLPWPLGAYSNERSFLSIENLCFVIKEIIENNKIGSGIYHLADDTGISTNNLIRIISDVLERKCMILKIPVTIINSISRLGDFLNLPLNSERLQKLTENYLVSNHKIIKALGKPLPISTDEGLRKTFKSFRKQ